MKLSGIAVIFVIIIIPILLVVSYYISLQADTLNMQTAYNTKLLQSVKDAIEAFEINTVEWNDAYSQVGDSKRRDIMASLNTFTTSLANSIGVGGANKQVIMSYIPAIAFTMYDGYYIYSPSEVKEIIKDENGVAVFVKESLTGTTIQDYTYNSADENKILYIPKEGVQQNGTYNGTPFTLNPSNAQTTYSHILKPFIPYSARYKTEDNNIDIVVNYTLDNYITIYGMVNGTYVKKSGYLVDTNKIEIDSSGIRINGEDVEPENLTEKIAWKNPDPDDDSWPVVACPYVYEAENNTKVYFDEDDENKLFQVSGTGIRTDLSDLSTVKYKKLSILSSSDGTKCMEIYQVLNDGTTKNGDELIKGTWYIKRNSNEEATDYGQENIGLEQDISAWNYYVESYAFSQWVKAELSDITIKNMVKNDQIPEDSIGVYGNTEGDMGEQTIFDLSNIEYKNSTFNLHKREVIKQSIITNLNQAITSYSRNSAGNYYLPVLSETDWDQILENVSIIAFLQGIPIGLKEYNNYAIATSTSNREYVDPNEIYLSDADKSNQYYHLPYCSQLTETDNLIGYRSTDYRIRTYNQGDTNEGHYYKHEDIANQACYNCLVQRSLYEKETDVDKIENHKKAYLTALAREKYVARKTEL